jgi:tRNA dimethylallyltransferase
LINKLNTEGVESLRFELMRIDPEYCKKADLQNPKRILKALEVYYQTGKKYSSLRSGDAKPRNFNIVKFCLNMPRETLYDRIDMRCDSMLQAGLLDEVRLLIEFKKLNALNTVGYKEFFEYFDKQYSFEEAVRLFKRNSRHYAKRQLTWFRREKDLIWLEKDTDENLCEKILTYTDLK